MSMLCFVGTMNAQSNVNWKIVAPEDGGQYYLYSLIQKKYLNDDNGWDETATTLWDFALAGTQEEGSLRFTLTASESGNKFATYNSWGYKVVSNSTGSTGTNYSNEFRTAGDYNGYSFYRADKWTLSNARNLNSTESFLSFSKEPTYEFVFVSKQQYDAYLSQKDLSSQSRTTAENGYGTICLPYQFTVSNANVYTVGGFEENNTTLVLNAVETTVPGQPYIYQATDASNSQTFVKDEAGNIAPEPLDDDYLVGFYSATTVPAGNYVLQNQNGVYAFYKTTAEKAAGTYRCYLDGTAVPTASAVKGISFAEASATAIKAVSTLTSSTVEAVYSTNGARQNGLQKGLNIVKMSDGSVQKVLVK